MEIRIPCNCGSMININTDKEDKSGWMFYDVELDVGLRKRGICPKCQAAMKCYIDFYMKDVTPKVEPKEEPRKRGRPPKKKEE